MCWKRWTATSFECGDRLTPREQAYLNAMAQLGAGPHRSGAIAEAMGLKVA